MGTRLQSGLVTEAEFLALPESMDRIELIDGEVTLPPSPTPRHQLVLGRLFRAISTWADAHAPAFVGLAPLDVRIAEGRIVQPDLFVLRGGWSGDDGPIEAVPELVVEVLSQRRGYDRITKRLIYAEAGVAEYWVVDPTAQTLELYSGIEPMAPERTRVTSGALEGLTVELEPLWR
ncbi:MAG: Uma2 family endonuclease [Deltaproteobacteria bacterium]|nr:Uma2 family endonuclease [Nannocystaceae bacterium]